MVGPLALPLGTSNVMVTQAGAGRPPGLFPPRNRPSSRSWTLSLAVRASKAGGQDGHPLPPYGDLLQQREYELWQRQNRLYDQLLEQHERDRQHWESERQRWVQQETSLKQEVAELRAQLLYLLQSGGAQPRSPSDVRSAAGSTASSSAGSGGSLYAQAPPPRLPAQPTGQLPQPAAGLTAADQVKAVVEAVKAGTSPFDSGAVASSSPATVEEAAMPRYVAELAAAVAAVDELDVLGDINFGNLANRLLSQGWIQGGIQQQEESAVEVDRQQQRPSTPQQPAAPSAGPAGNGSGPAAAPSPAPSRGVGVVSAGPAAAQQNLQSRPPSQPPAAQQQPQRGQGERPVEQLAGAEPAEPAPAPGPRPTLVSGSDDIYWVNELHRALVLAGYYPGEDDVEDFFFGDSTLSAVMTLQACMGLTETGVVDEATWEALLAAQSSDEEGEGPAEAEKAGEPSTGTPTASSGSSSSPSQKPYQDLFAAALGGKQQQQPPVPGQPRQGSSSRDAWNGRPASPAVHVVQEVVLADIVQSTGAGEVQETVTVHEEVKVVGAGAAGSTARTAWPVLMEGDGGREVHALHVALQQGGCYASDDDMRWWQFGDSTLAAVKTFQACNGLPESGVADPATWRALLGAGASPADLDTLRSEDSADDDLGNTANRVWLMGEQRWEDRGRLKRRQGA